MRSVMLYLLTLILTLSPLMLTARETKPETLPTELLFINDKLVTLETPILVKNEVYYVPLRDTCKLLNLEISYTDNPALIQVSSATNQFLYDPIKKLSTFDSKPIDLDLFIEKGITYINPQTFYSLFGFDVELDGTLFMSKYIGTEYLDFEYLDKPKLIEQYEDTPVTSILINSIPPATSYTSGTIDVEFIDAFFKEGILYITFEPYTTIITPSTYNNLNENKIFNHIPTTLTLPIHSSFLYEYLKTPFTREATSNFTKTYTDIKRTALYLGTLTIQDDQITSIVQLYTP